ncbi:MAG: deoxyribonuclease IV [Lachnospiraceae bacterium]|nr:deoxyribonuclease IV [Lachnospiraceae bacterium]
MIYIGNHVSISKGYEAMGLMEEKLGGTTFAFFTRNPRGGKSTAVDTEDVKKLQKFLEEKKFGPLVAHAPYTMNLCSAKEDVREFGLQMLKEDLEKMELLPGQFFNFHPGSHLKQGYEAGRDMIVDALNQVLYPEMTTTVLLETMAGKGSEVGRNFTELKGIMDGVTCKEKLGVCLDTCHVWEAGYDIVTSLDKVLEEFDRIIGIDRLKALHLNDSKNPMGAAKDRHEKLGLGCIGKEALMRVVQHPMLQGRPFILETPNDDAGYKDEIAMVKQWMKKEE